MCSDPVIRTSSGYVFGDTNYVGSSNSTVIGTQNCVSYDKTNSKALVPTGDSGKATETYGYNVALGYQNTIGGVSNAIAIGRGSTVSGEKGIAIGYYANASAEMAVAIGYNAVASTAPKMVVSGSDKTTETWMTTVSFGNQATGTGGSAKTYLARLKNIYEGEDDYDAVNVKQLKSYVKDNSGKTYTGTDPITVDNTNNTISIRNMAMGADAKGTTGATATGNAAIALGQGASAGVSEKASDYNSNVAIGKGATTTSTTYTPTGGSATTIGTSGSSIAIGTSAKTTGDSAIAIGKESQGTRNNTIAIGASAKAKEAYATALGGSTEASGSCSTAIGFYAKAQSDYAIAIGFATVEKAASNSIAIGNDAKASKENSVAIGKGSKATEANTVSVGSGNSSQAYGFRRIVNVADGTAITDAATYGQLIKNQQYTFDSSTGIATIETNAGKTAFTLKLSSNGSVAETDSGLISGAKVYAEVRPTENGNYIKKDVTTANNLKALDDAIGSNKDIATTGGTIQNEKSVNENLKLLDGQVMTNTKAISDLSTTVTKKDTELENKIGTLDTAGTYNVIKVENNVSQNLAALDNAITSSVTPNVQHLKDITRSETAEANGKNSLALGDKSHADGDSSISFGTNATASAANAVSIGTGSTVTGESSIAVGTGHIVHGKNSGAFGDPDNIHGDNSYSFGNNNVIGDHDAGDGAIGNNTFVVGNKNTVTGDNTFVVGNNVTTSANNAVILGNNSTATEDGVVSVGSEGNERKITNVAAGEKDTDAVNVSQLKKAMQGNALEVNDALNDLDQRINKVGAGAAALAALHPETFDPSNKLNFAIGYGHYKNANAGAFGAFYKPNQDTTVSAGSTFGNGNPMVNMGVSFKIGKRGQNLAANASNAELVQEVNHLRAQNNRYEERIDAQEKKIADLEEKMQKLLQKVGKV